MISITSLSCIFLLTLSVLQVYGQEAISSNILAFGVVPSPLLVGSVLQYEVDVVQINFQENIIKPKNLLSRGSSLIGFSTLISTLDRNTRILYSVSAQRFHQELPKIVGFDIENNQVVSELIFQNHFIYNLEFDAPNRRLLAVAWNSATTELQFISINATSGAVTIHIPSLSNCESAHLGVSAFDPSNQIFFSVMDCDSTELFGRLVSISSENYTILAQNPLQSFLTSIDFEPQEQLSPPFKTELYGITIEPSLQNISTIAFSEIDSQDGTETRITTFTSPSLNVDVEPVFSVQANDRFSPNMYNLLNIQQIHSFVNHDLNNLDASMVIYPKDAAFTNLFTISNCTNGRYEDSNQFCVKCEAGKYQDLYEQKSCKNCSLGTFTNITGSSLCSLCPSGHFQNESGAVTCKKCPHGTFQNKQGQSSCYSCIPGFVSNTTGAPSCDPCLPGQIQPLEGQTFCTPCSNGTFNPNFGGKICSQCQPGHFAKTQGSAFCPPCRAGTWAPYYGQADCYACPEGGVCDEGSFDPYSAPGYFESNLITNTFVMCVPLEACIGRDSCSSGYNDYACSKCNDGFYKVDNLYCKECPPAAALRFIIFLIVMFILIFVILGLIVRYRNKLGTLKRTGFYSSVFIGYNFYQVASQLSSFQFSWPDLTRQFLGWTWFANFNSDNLASACTFNLTFLQKHLLVLFLPIILIGIICSRWFLLWIVHRGAVRWEPVWKRKYPRLFDTSTNGAFIGSLKRAITWFMTKKDEENIQRIFNETINASTTALAALYLFVASFVLSFFDCLSQPDGTFTLESVPDLQCFETDWLKILPIVLSSIILYLVGIPVLLFRLLYVHRKKLADEDIYSRYGMLYIRYKSNVYFWEMLIIGRKLVITATKLFFNSNILAQGILAVVTLAAFDGLQVWKKPFLVSRHNIMETVLIATNVWLLVLGVIYYKVKFNETAMNVMVILTLSVATVYIIGMFIIDLLTHVKTVRGMRDSKMEDRESNISISGEDFALKNSQSRSSSTNLILTDVNVNKS